MTARQPRECGRDVFGPYAWSVRCNRDAGHNGDCSRIDFPPGGGYLLAQGHDRQFMTDSRWRVDSRAHPAYVTLDRLLSACECWHNRLSGGEKEAVSAIRDALSRIIAEDQAATAHVRPGRDLQSPLPQPRARGNPGRTWPKVGGK